jgi:hypothetical protein
LFKPVVTKVEVYDVESDSDKEEPAYLSPPMSPSAVIVSDEPEDTSDEVHKQPVATEENDDTDDEHIKKLEEPPKKRIILDDSDDDFDDIVIRPIKSTPAPKVTTQKQESKSIPSISSALLSDDEDDFVTKKKEATKKSPSPTKTTPNNRSSVTLKKTTSPPKANQALLDNFIKTSNTPSSGKKAKLFEHLMKDDFNEEESFELKDSPQKKFKLPAQDAGGDPLILNEDPRVEVMIETARLTFCRYQAQLTRNFATINEKV